MQSTPTGRRPDGRLSALSVLLLLILPVLVGGWGSSPSTSSVEAAHGSTPSTELLWVFLSDEGWEDPTTHLSLTSHSSHVRFKSEWLKAVSVEVPAELISSIANLSGVVGVRLVGRLAAWNPPDRESWGYAPFAFSPRPVQSLDSIYGGLRESLAALGITQAHSLGFTGSGVRIGILDGTFMEYHATLRTSTPIGVRDFVDGDNSVYPGPFDPPGSASHGTALWSLVSAELNGILKGAASGSDILLARIRGFDDLSTTDEDRWVAGLEWLESQGARIVISGVSFRNLGSTSYGWTDLNGDIAPASRAADQAAQRGVLVLAPVGNGGPGPQTLEAPADGDSVLAVGAVDGQGVPVSSSAWGPTVDGRTKPDLFAPGLTVQAASGPGDQGLEQVTGTEYSAALLAGGAALLVEAYPNLGPMQIVDMLRNSVMPEYGAAVGIPRVATAIVFPQGISSLPLQELNGEGEVTNLAPHFQWTAPTIHPLGLPVTFYLELSEDSLFQGITSSDSVVGTFARRIRSPLPPRTSLYWRVRARTAQGVEDSTIPVGPISVPSWVSLDVPNEPAGSELVNPQPEFRWSTPDLLPPAGPFSFELQIVSDRESELIQSYSNLVETEFEIPSPLPFNLPLRWRVIAQAQNGAVDTVTSSGPFVVTSGANPPATVLYQNFPNPFPNSEYGGGETRIWFDLADPAEVELVVYDIRGRLVRSLIPASGCAPMELTPGLYGRDEGPPSDPCQNFSWDGTDEGGQEVSPGVYLLRLRAGSVVEVRRVVFWK